MEGHGLHNASSLPYKVDICCKICETGASFSRKKLAGLKNAIHSILYMYLEKRNEIFIAVPVRLPHKASEN